jgi:hypothetical protein
MSSASTFLQIAIAVGVLALVIGRRFAPRPVRGDGRRWRLPLLLCAFGVWSLVSLGRHAPPVHVTGTDAGYLVICGAISAALGLLRGVTIRIYPLNGQLVQRYSPTTVALWIATVVVRLGMDLSASSFGVAKDVASASLLLMFGISLLGESLIVAARTGRTGAFGTLR